MGGTYPFLVGSRSCFLFHEGMDAYVNENDGSFQRNIYS
jgi:hypothetical protein